MPKEAWSYALLLILLCAIASIAVWQTIDYLAERLPEHDFQVAAAVIWAITLGFMLIAGAFGLWATQFAAVAETARRVSRMVEAMDYIRDAVVAIDAKGRVTGANPAAKVLAHTSDLDRKFLHTVFPSVSNKDVLLLTNARAPNEIERSFVQGGVPRVLRFRSQPSKNISMLIISDITTLNERQAGIRQAAQLQLVGEISRGVAHDFNTLLCEISGHASLVHKLAPPRPELQASTKAIIQAAERGVGLSGQLIELAQTAPRPSPSRPPNVYLQNAATSLRNMLSEKWRVETNIEELPFLSLTGSQLEQIVLNLGLLAADALRSPGILSVSAYPAAATRDASQSSPGHPAVVVDIEARQPEMPPGTPSLVSNAGGEEPRGAIQSVIRTLVMQMNGSLDTLHGDDGATRYRLQLPRGQEPSVTAAGKKDFPTEMVAYVSGWRTLLITPRREFSLIEARMHELNMRVQRTNNIMSGLTHIENEPMEAVVLDGQLIEQEMQGMLRAIMKLRPGAGIVVLCDDPGKQPDAVVKDVRFLAANAEPDAVMLAIVEARSLAMRRAQSAG